MIRARGDAERFLQILEEYQKARAVTAARLYIESMEQILPNAKKVVIGPEGTEGILKFLPLGEISGKKNEK